ncbi:MAG TPA: hypothetical protein VIG48_02050 [Jatrophihabitans sp.]|jgi:hypothetical protein
MRLGPSFALLVFGAILTFAVTAHVSGFNIHVAGVILMLAGLAAVGYHLKRERTPRRTDVIAEPGHTTYLEPSELRDPQYH